MQIGEPCRQTVTGEALGVEIGLPIISPGRCGHHAKIVSGGHVGESDESIEARIRAAQVGDTVRIRIDKSQLSAEVRDRVSPVMEPSADSQGQATFRAITKDAAGLWDLEQATSARDGKIVEVVIRRAASDL